jgi:hypothetical protein
MGAERISDVKNVRVRSFASARGRHAGQDDRLRRDISSGANTFV